MSARASGSTARSPRDMLTVTGKKVRYAALTAFENQDVPSQTTTIGAMARIGTVCDATTYGKSPRSSQRECAKPRSEEHTSELQSLTNLVCRLLLEKKK